MRERRSVSADMAVRLARLFGTTSQYWLNMQRNVDLWDALDLHKDEPLQVQPLAAFGQAVVFDWFVGSGLLYLTQLFSSSGDVRLNQSPSGLCL